MKQEYIKASRRKEIVRLLIRDPLLSMKGLSKEFVLNSYERYWSDAEGRWIKPTKSCKAKIVVTALKELG